MRPFKDIDSSACPGWCWGIGTDEETLDCDANHCIEMHLDGLAPAEMPEKLTIWAYERRKLTADHVDPESTLEDILERLDEEHANPDGDATEPTKAMTEAARALAGAIAKDYVIHWCDKVEAFAVDVLAWCEENAPHWLEAAGE